MCRFASPHIADIFPHCVETVLCCFITQDSCQGFLDKYTECEWTIIFLDVLLHRVEVLRHLLFNTQFTSLVCAIVLCWMGMDGMSNIHSANNAQEWICLQIHINSHAQHVCMMTSENST